MNLNQEKQENVNDLEAIQEIHQKIQQEKQSLINNLKNEIVNTEQTKLNMTMQIENLTEHYNSLDVQDITDEKTQEYNNILSTGKDLIIRLDAYIERCILEINKYELA
jgi:hypothetical protein